MITHLIRHTSVNVPKNYCYGHTEVPLNNTFSEEAKNIREKNSALLKFRCYVSPSARCYDLAVTLGFTEIVKDERLKELNFGSWEGRLWSDIPFEESEPWTSNIKNTRCLQGEGYQDLKKRLSDFMNEILSLNLSTVVCITHAGPIKLLIEKNSSLSFEEVMTKKVNFGSVTSLKWDRE